MMVKKLIKTVYKEMTIEECGQCYTAGNVIDHNTSIPKATLQISMLQQASLWW